MATFIIKLMIMACLVSYFEIVATQDGVCSKAIKHAMDMFKVSHDGSMMLIFPDEQPDSFAHCDGFRMLEQVEIPNKIVSKSRISDIREAIIAPDNIIVILGEDVEDFGYLTTDIPVLKKIVFICMQNAAKDSLKLTGHFPHSMVLAADPESNGIKCYRRLHFYEEMYEISEDMSECGDFSIIQTDFHAHTLHAVAFDFFPYSKPDFEKQENHAGFEYEIASAILDSLNVKMKVSKPSDGGWWGNEAPKGSGNWTGLFGDLQTGVADLGWGNLYTAEVRKAFMDFTDWYLVDPMCILVQRPEAKSRLSILTLPMNKEVWFFGILSLIAIALFYVIHNRFEGDIIPTDNLILHGLAITLRENDNFQQSKETKSLRVVHGFFNVYMLILTSAYCGSLISFLSIEVYPEPPDTFDEVATEVVERDLKVSVCCQEVIDVLGESSLQSFQTMSPRVYQPEGWDEGFVKTSKGEDVYIYSRNALEITRRINTYRVEYDSLHVSQECFLPLNVAIGLRKQNPIKDAMNHRLLQLKEAGIISKLIMDGQDMTADAASLATRNSREVSQDTELTPSHLEGLFQLSLAILGSGIFVFVLEITRFRINKHLFSEKHAKTIMVMKIK